MSTAIESLPSRHKVSWKGWVIALAAAALLAGAIGTYMALQNGSAAAPSIVQTVRPSIPAIPVKNLQPGAPARGPVIAEMRDVGGIPGPVTQQTSGQAHQGQTGSAETSSSAPGTPPPNCLNIVNGGPC
jgi:hypothetical protein